MSGYSTWVALRSFSYKEKLTGQIAFFTGSKDQASVVRSSIPLNHE